MTLKIGKRGKKRDITSAKKGGFINAGINAVYKRKRLYEAHIKAFINDLNKVVYKQSNLGC